MAYKKPLVLTDGEIEQLQSGDALSIPISGALTVTATNSNGSTAPFGSAVYSDADDSFDLALADAPGTKNVLGLVADVAGIATSVSGSVATDGVLVADATTDWDAVTGGSGGLVAGDFYYLSADTAGYLTNDPTSFAAGEYVAKVGIALSTLAMDLRIESTILL